MYELNHVNSDKAMERKVGLEMLFFKSLENRKEIYKVSYYIHIYCDEII